MEITSGIAHVEAASGDMPVFVAQPVTGGPSPAVVVVQEAFGLNGHIKAVAARLAGEGYLTLAPDLYYREPGAVAAYDDLPEAIRLMGLLSDDNIIADMGAVLAYLQQRADVRGDRIGMTGFCMGGRVTFLTACLNPAVKAAVPFYGGGIGSTKPSSGGAPKAPLEYADRLTAPVLLFFGENDPFIPLDEVERIRTRLAERSKVAEVVVYPGAPHGFFCDERDAYRPDAAADAWRRMLGFFDRYLKS